MAWISSEEGPGSIPALKIFYRKELITPHWTILAKFSRNLMCSKKFFLTILVQFGQIYPILSPWLCCWHCVTLGTKEKINFWPKIGTHQIGLQFLWCSSSEIQREGSGVWLNGFLAGFTCFRKGPVRFRSNFFQILVQFGPSSKI